MLDMNEPGALIERFAVAKPDYALHAEREKDTALKKENYDQAGLKGGSVESIHKTSALATKDAQNSSAQEAERKSKRQYDDTLFMALLQQGDLDSFVAENTFGGLSDEEISAVVEDIEAETGKSVEDYAKDILGENMPERGANESEADYHRRVLTVVAEEVLEEDGVTFKPGYENDPVARIVQESDVYKDAQAFSDQQNAMTPKDAPADDAAIDSARDKAEESYYVSKILGEKLENTMLSGTARDVQDDGADNSLDAISSNTLDFGAALSLASDDFGAEFESAAAQPAESEAVSPAPAHDVTPVAPT